MFLRVVRGSFVRQQRRKTVAVLATALGTAVAVALLAVNINVGDKINRELKAFGANITVTPKDEGIPLVVNGVDLRGTRAGTFLDDRGLGALHTFFWRNNVLSYAPFLPVEARVADVEFTLNGSWFSRTPNGAPHPEGLKSIFSAWRIDGGWPDDYDMRGVLVGTTLARKLGAQIGHPLNVRVGTRHSTLLVRGIVTSGGPEDEQALVPIETAQKLLGEPHAVRRVVLSALTTPESQIYEKYHKDPRKMPAEEFEHWSCTPYASAIALQVQDAIPNSTAHVVRQVSSTEGVVLDKLQTLILAVSVTAFLCAVLSVIGSLSTTVIERRQEIGLMKALGCQNEMAALFFVAEAIGIGLLGGVLGLGLGVALSQIAARLLFGAGIAFNAVLVPIAFGVAALIALLGSLANVRAIMRLHPVEALSA